MLLLVRGYGMIGSHLASFLGRGRQTQSHYIPYLLS